MANLLSKFSIVLTISDDADTPQVIKWAEESEVTPYGMIFPRDLYIASLNADMNDEGEEFLLEIITAPIEEDGKWYVVIGM